MSQRPPVRPTRLRSIAFLLLAGLLLAACSAAGSPTPGVTAGPSGSGGPTGTAGPSGGIAHPTGPSDVILRMEVGGGFVPIGWLVTQAPTFSLYGDGTVLFRSTSGPQPSAVGSVIRSVPFRTGRLTEAQVQELLGFALESGGLRAARDLYDPGNVADAPSTIFTIDAGLLEKTVTVVALGIGTWGKDQAAVAAFQRLADRLNGTDAGGILTGTYAPTRYRGILTESPVTSAADVRAWPWPGLTPADWKLPTDKGRPSFPTRTMTPAEVAVLGIPSPEGGFQNLLVRDEAGKLYAFAVRPLLPDEAS